MEIEIEDRAEDILSNEEDNQEENVQQKRTRGRKKKQKQGWEETIEIVIPELKTKKDQHSEKKEQKPKNKQNKNAEMEIEEYGDTVENYKELSKQIIEKKGKFNHIFNIIEYYNITINNLKADILTENFENLIQKIYGIFKNKMQDLPLFLNYIQLLIDKSHLDLLIQFNKQLEYEVQLKSQDLKQDVYVIKYQGGNQIFKILTHFKNEVDSILQKLHSKKIKEKPHLVLCLFDGAYNISKQDMVDIGKFFQEEYEQFSNFIQLVIIFPVSQLTPIPDIQIYTVEFCKQKDLFVKFLLFILKSEEFPPLPQDLFKAMLYEFDLYQITYNDQVRRVKMVISNFLYDHQNDENLINLLYQMKEHVQNQLAGQDDEDESEQDNEQNDVVPNLTSQQKKKLDQIKSKQIKKPSQKTKEVNQKNLIDKIDLWAIKKQIKMIIQFLEAYYNLNQNKTDQSHRIIEIILNEDKNYVMTEIQQKEFFKNPQNSCKSIQQLLDQYSKDQEGKKLFEEHAKTLKDIDNKVNDDLKLLKNQRTSSNDRYAQSQQINKHQSEKDREQQVRQKKKERVESIIRQITYDLHNSFKTMITPKLSLDISQLNSQCRPDILGSLMIHKTIIDPMHNKQTNQNKKKKQEIIEINADGLYLVHILENYGKKFLISESFKEYKSILRERKIELDEDQLQASYFNAICELRYLGMIEVKRKLKNEFIKHFFAKSSYFPLTQQNC